MRKKLTAEEERREAELAALSDPAAQAARRLREAEAWRQEQEAQDTVIQLLHGDISERDRQIQLQRSLLKAAKQWMLENRPAAPPPN